MRIFFISFLFAALTACGPLNEGRGSPEIFKQLQSQLGGADEAPTAPAIPPEVANAGPGEVLLVTLRARNAVAPLLKSAQNGSKITWTSPGQVSMTFDNGILISTRGLGDDLMGADVPGLFAAVQNGAGTIQRRQSYLNSLDQIITHDLTCQVASVGVEQTALLSGPQDLEKVVEACQSPRLVFENSYWLRDGQIVKSLQVIAASQGYITAEQL